MSRIMYAVSAVQAAPRPISAKANTYRFHRVSLYSVSRRRTSAAAVCGSMRLDDAFSAIRSSVHASTQAALPALSGFFKPKRLGAGLQPDLTTEPAFELNLLGVSYAI